MTDVERLIPSQTTVNVVEELSRLSSGQQGLVPFDSRVIAFIDNLSRRLRRDPVVRRAPALAALSYWIRSANITRLQTDWKSMCEPQTNLVRVPQGVVFHLPPRNVDTLFVYSWLLSALAGNANIVRLSQGALDESAQLVDLIAKAVAEDEILSSTTSIITYGHEASITSALSLADLRVIWGGDDTIAAIRALPSAPYCRDIAFPDRYSMALMRADRIIAADDAGIRELAHRFYNDAYWFDQLGCASPRLIMWLGEPASAHVASARFRDAVRGELQRRGHESPGTSAVLSKLVHSADLAAQGAVVALDWSHNDATFARIDHLNSHLRDSPGGGLFYEAILDNITQLASFVTRKDQTLSYFGLTETEVHQIVNVLGSRGIDRIVPIGDALTFGRFWDGRDLLTEFSRAIFIS